MVCVVHQPAPGQRRGLIPNYSFHLRKGLRPVVGWIFFICFLFKYLFMDRFYNLEAFYFHPRILIVKIKIWIKNSLIWWWFNGRGGQMAAIPIILFFSCGYASCTPFAFPWRRICMTHIHSDLIWCRTPTRDAGGGSLADLGAPTSRACFWSGDRHGSNTCLDWELTSISSRRLSRRCLSFVETKYNSDRNLITLLKFLLSPRTDGAIK